MSKSKLNDTTLYKAINRVALALRSSAISAETYEKVLRPVKKPISYIAQKMGTDHDQAWVFAAVFQVSLSEDRSISVRNVREFLDCSPSFAHNVGRIVMDLCIRGYLDIEEAKRYASIHMRGEGLRVTDYIIPDEVLACIMENKPFSIQAPSDDSLKLMEMLAMLAEKYRMDNLNYALYEMKVRLLFRQFGEAPVVKAVKRSRLDLMEQVFLILTLHGELSGCLERVSCLCDSTTDYSYGSRAMMRDLIADKHRLITGKWVEFEEGLYRAEHSNMRPGPRSRQLFASVAQITRDKEMPYLQMLHHIAPADITPVALYYPQSFEQRYDELRAFCDEERLTRVAERLKEQGLPAGFTVLMYGPPGTGKTELVRQLARETGRALLQVDMALIKSMWVGNSEKHVKAIFEEYRKAKDFFDKAPILLLNEADALIGKRAETTPDDNSSVRNMLNTMQNIMLQEMEDFTGLLMATTNFEANFDDAFERRFLYKLEFHRPDADTRQGIWISRFPDLPAADILRLSDYDLSGAQITNIARKATTHHVLYGTPIDVKLLEQLVEEETGYRKKAVERIGFKRGKAA